MNEFREWLSDNLRYFMLGGGILLALILIFLGIRLISSKTSGNDTPNEVQAETTPTPEEKQEEPSSTPTETPTPEPTPSDELAKNAVPEVNTLIEQYYTAIAAKDIEKLRTLVDTLTEEDENNISGDPVESYRDINVYTLSGLTDGSYITYVSYKYKLPDINTEVPGLSQLYIQTDEAGSLYVCTSAPNAETQLLIEKSVDYADVKQLISHVQSEYETAVNSDDALYAYFNPDASNASEETASAEPEPTPEVTPEPTPEPAPEESTVPEGEWVVLKQAANIRDCAGMKKSTVIGCYPAGTKMIKLGEEGLWFHVYVDGVYGYISNMYF